MARAGDLGSLLDDTIQPSALAHPRQTKRGARRPFPETPPLIAAWRAEQSATKQGWFKRWASSQVAGYRMELIIGYLTLMLFGGAAIAAGIPIFSFTTPEGFTPIWGSAIILGGLVAAAGALRAGEEVAIRDPKHPTALEIRFQKVIRVFNRLELAGTITLFLMLGTYSVLLLMIGNGAFQDQRLASDDTATQLANLGRIAVGCAILSLGSHPTVRMVWLIFRPGKILTHKGEVTAGTVVTDVDTGPLTKVKDES